MNPTRPEPSTAAGRALLADVHGDDRGFGYDVDREAILAIEAEARPTIDLRSIVEEIRDRLAARGKPQHPEWSVLILAALDRAAAASAPKENE